MIPSALRHARPSSNKGFSLIELLLVLGVLAILLVAAFVVYPQVRDRNQANKEIMNLSVIRANVNNLYASKPSNYTGLTNQVALDAKVFPSDMAPPGATQATSAWGQPVEVTSDNPSGQRFFRTRYRGMSSNLCTLMVPSVAKDYEEIVVYLSQGGGLIINKQTSISDIINFCGSDEQGTLDIVFVAK
jgi:prepilin-type N-terminal cleavage/methylation domain-containing protein